MPPTELIERIARADERIRPIVRETPLDHSRFFSQQCGAQVFLKLENLQHTGSFKLRGALNKLLSIEPTQRALGVVAASSGNHGAAVAYAADALHVPALIFTPETASPTKLAAMRRYGAEVKQVGDDSLISELAAREFAESRGLTYISPYNDLDVVAGQGTIGAEIVRQLAGASIDMLFAAVGGGGLIGGLAAFLRAHNPNLRVIGCQPQHSCVMTESVRAGRVLDLPSLPTLSDGTAGGIELDALTFDLCRQVVDDYAIVSEDEIAVAMRLVMESQHLLVEGAAGVAVAGLLQKAGSVASKNVVVVLCGANISLTTLRTVLFDSDSLASVDSPAD
jgi:threonine dehydratase